MEEALFQEKIFVDIVKPSFQLEFPLKNVLHENFMMEHKYTVSYNKMI